MYIQDIFQEDFAAIHENNIALCDIYSEYFLEPETEEPLIEDYKELRDEKEIPEEVLDEKEFKELSFNLSSGVPIATPVFDGASVGLPEGWPFLA